MQFIRPVKIVSKYCTIITMFELKFCEVKANAILIEEFIQLWLKFVEIGKSPSADDLKPGRSE